MEGEGDGRLGVGIGAFIGGWVSDLVEGERVGQRGRQGGSERARGWIGALFEGGFGGECPWKRAGGPDGAGGADRHNGSEPRKLAGGPQGNWRIPMATGGRMETGDRYGTDGNRVADGNRGSQCDLGMQTERPTGGPRK